MPKEYTIKPDFSLGDEVYFIYRVMKSVDGKIDKSASRIVINQGNIMRIEAVICKDETELRYFVSNKHNTHYAPLYKDSIYTSKKEAEDARDKIRQKILDGKKSIAELKISSTIIQQINNPQWREYN